MNYAALKVGTTLNMGAYKIIRVLGQGGFGITYLAHDLNLDKAVAIKEFFPESMCGRDDTTNHITVGTQSASASVTDLKQRFLKEARNIAKLNHPNIIRIFSAFEENNTAYYVMEYVQGVSLAQLVKDNGALAEPIATGYIKEVGKALQYLHSNHMTHLDVKPANIMIDVSHTPVLIDFGLSKNYDKEGAPTTMTGPLGVSPGFSPSEQYMLSDQGGFSPQSDLYSLAATLYYLLTGITPTEAPMNMASLMPFPPQLPQNIKDAIIKAMAPTISQRHNSVTEFLVQLGGGYSTPSPGAPSAPGRPTMVQNRSAAGDGKSSTVLHQGVTPGYHPRNDRPAYDPNADKINTGPRRQASGGNNNFWTYVGIGALGALVVLGAVWLFAFSDVFSKKTPEIVMLEDPVAVEEKRNFRLGDPLPSGGNINQFETLSLYKIDPSDLYSYSKGELRILRNAIYAMHHYDFDSPDLQDYFGNFKGYSPITKYPDLSSTEQYNVNLIKSYE